MTDVYVSRCSSYDRADVDAALAAGLAATLGTRPSILPGQRIILKPNLLQTQPPEKGITTHPAVVAAVARWVKASGATPVIIDSPGGRSSWQSLKKLYEVTGMAQVASETGAELSYDVEPIRLPCPDGRMIKAVETMRAVVEADGVINLPKLKTHGLTRLTIATKNLFGTIPGVTKAGYHTKLATSEQFSDMLIDVLCRHSPMLTVTDAIVAMEGAGPASGDLRVLNVLLVSSDAVAADVVAAEIVGMDPLSIPPIAAAARRGLTTGAVKDIRLLGEPLDQVRVSDFQPSPAGIPDMSWIPPRLRSWVSGQLLASPAINARCIACNVCVENCPMHVIRIADGRARIDLKGCIRCYCCHELCPHDAVSLRHSPIGRLIGRTSR